MQWRQFELWRFFGSSMKAGHGLPPVTTYRVGDLHHFLCWSPRNDIQRLPPLGHYYDHSVGGPCRAQVFCGMRIAECGKLSRGNLRKIKCGTFRKLSPCCFSAFRSRKIPHFRGSQNYRSLALHNRCATDAYQRQPSRSLLKNEKKLKMVYWI